MTIQHNNMTKFAKIGKTLNNNDVIQYKGYNIYVVNGQPIRFEKAWFEIENPKRYCSEAAKYMLALAKKNMLKQGLQFAGHVQQIGEQKYRIVTWDHTFIMEDNLTKEEVEEFVLANSEPYDEDSPNFGVCNKVPYNESGIVFEENTTKFREFFCDIRPHLEELNKS